MTVSLRSAAQLLLLVAAVATLALTWASLPGNAPSFTAETVRGLDVAEGQVVVLACAIGIGLIQLELRPAWMASGFVIAVAGRELISLIGDDHSQPGIGLWLVLVSALAATALLLRDMAATMSRGPE